MPFPFAALIGGLATIGSTWVEGAVARKRLREERKVLMEQRRTEIELKRLDHEGSYDVEAQRQMQFSWKDEWFVILYSMPFIVTFMAPLVDAWNRDEPFVMTEAVLLAWQAVGEAPDWYWWIMIGMVVSTFGLRWMWNRRSV